MDYLKHYNLLMIKRKLHPADDSSQNIHKHHIIPRSLGGQDKDDNIVKLTMYEHYIAHCLLWMYYKSIHNIRYEKKMNMALNILISGRPQITEKIKFNKFLFLSFQERRLILTSRKLEYNGEIHTIKEWSRIAGISYSTFRSRIYNGWKIEKAIKQPSYTNEIKNCKKFEVSFRGKKASIEYLSKKYNIPSKRIYERYKSCNDIEKCLFPIDPHLITAKDGRSHSLKQWSKILGIKYGKMRNLIYGKKLSIDDIIYNNYKTIEHKLYDYNGKSQTIFGWSKELKINREFITKNIRAGKTIGDIVKEHNKKYFNCDDNGIKMFTYKNQTKTLHQFAIQYKIKYITLRTRVYQKKWSIEKAIETPIFRKKSESK